MKFKAPIVMSLMPWLLVACSPEPFPLRDSLLNEPEVAPFTEDESSDLAANPADFFRYHFKNESCTTDEHIFKTQKDFCDSLIDNEKNNRCAVHDRVELFRKKCSPVENQLPVIPAGHNAKCVVEASNLLERVYLDKSELAPTKHQKFTDIDWSQDKLKAVSILEKSSGSFGSAELRLMPQTETTPEWQQTTLKDEKNQFVVGTRFGAPIKVSKINHSEKNEVSATCVSDSKTTVVPSRSDQSLCRFTLKTANRGKQNGEFNLNLNDPSKNSRSLKFKNLNSELVVRLSAKDQNEVLNFDYQLLGSQQTLSAEVLLGVGLQASVHDILSGHSFEILCVDASK